MESTRTEEGREKSFLGETEKGKEKGKEELRTTQNGGDKNAKTKSTKAAGRAHTFFAGIEGESGAYKQTQNTSNWKQRKSETRRQTDTTKSKKLGEERKERND